MYIWVLIILNTMLPVGDDDYNCMSRNRHNGSPVSFLLGEGTSISMILLCGTYCTTASEFESNYAYRPIFLYFKLRFYYNSFLNDF
jgi:hypothetical protein